jgi:hypothetical protein
MNAFQSRRSTPTFPVLSNIHIFSPNLNIIATWSYSPEVKALCIVEKNDLPLKRRMSPVLAVDINSSSENLSDFQKLFWIATLVRFDLNPRLVVWCLFKIWSQSMILLSSYSQTLNSNDLFDPRMSILKVISINKIYQFMKKFGKSHFEAMFNIDYNGRQVCIITLHITSITIFINANEAC